jgi:hypothetical protein
LFFCDDQRRSPSALYVMTVGYVMHKCISALCDCDDQRRSPGALYVMTMGYVVHKYIV